MSSIIRSTYTSSFSGFSVGCCINREVIWKITLPTFRLNAPVIRAKVKKVQNNVAIYSHALPRIHVIGGPRSVRVAPPSLLASSSQWSSNQGLPVLHLG